jgi:hypothetical protein
VNLEFDDANSQSLVVLYTGEQPKAGKEAVVGWVGSLFVGRDSCTGAPRRLCVTSNCSKDSDLKLSSLPQLSAAA